MKDKTVRELRGKLTRKQFADLVGVSDRTIEGWEHGREIGKLGRALLRAVRR